MTHSSPYLECNSKFPIRNNEISKYDHKHTNSLLYDGQSLHTYKEDKLQKLWITEKALKEMTEKYIRLEGDYVKVKEELEKYKEICAAMENKQAKEEISLKKQVKSLIYKLSKTKLNLNCNSSKKNIVENNENSMQKLGTTFGKQEAPYMDNTKSISCIQNKKLRGEVIYTDDYSKISMKSMNRHAICRGRYSCEGIEKSASKVMENINMNIDPVQKSLDYMPNNVKRIVHNHNV